MTSTQKPKIWIPTPNQEIDGYLLEEPICLSGEADVFLASKNGEKFAIKIYRDATPPDIQLEHNLPHILSPIFTGIAEGRAIEITPYRELGNTKNIKTWSEANLKSLLDQVSTALNTLHSRGIKHRDLKPENILIKNLQPLEVEVCDFGTASRRSDTTFLTTAVGTLAHSAPEAATGVTSPAGDFFSLGSTLLELQTGQNTFSQKTAKEQYFLAVQGKREIPKSLSPAWKDLYKGLLHDDHKTRWGYKEIRRWLQGQTVPTPKKRIKNFFKTPTGKTLLKTLTYGSIATIATIGIILVSIKAWNDYGQWQRLPASKTLPASSPLYQTLKNKIENTKFSNPSTGESWNSNKILHIETSAGDQNKFIATVDLQNPHGTTEATIQLTNGIEGPTITGATTDDKALTKTSER
jgi:serine/threonine protein kinase